MSIITLVKGLIHRMFAANDIKTALGVDPAFSSNMTERLKLWSSMYAGTAGWTNDAVRSLRLEQGITREFSNIAVGEMTADVSVPVLGDALKNALRDININLQLGLATGAMIIKPMPDMTVQYLAQTAFIPIEYDSRGKLIKVIFPETKKSGDAYFTRLEFHSLDKNGLTITNRAFVSYNKAYLGRETSLGAFPDWQNIRPSITYPKMTRPVYGYYRNPIDNTIDGSFAGVSIFESAVDLIRRTDTQFGRLDWEFESGERAILVDPAALKLEGRDREGRNVYGTPKLNKRLFHAVDITQKEGELLKEFSPEFREQSIISGLEEYKRNIEFAVGLSYGDISNPATIEKTATEIAAAKKRKYNTVTAIQNNLCDCLDDLVYAFAFWSAKTTSGYEFICDFKDSILTDEETERQQDRSDVAMGVMRLDEYRAKWYGEPLETAVKNLPDPPEVS